MHKKPRKVRALNKSVNFKKEILRLHEDEGLTPQEIVAKFNGQLTYWQVYNTINPRLPEEKTFVNPSGELLTDEEPVPDSIITSVPETDLSQFGSIDKYFEHSLSIIIKQLEGTKISLEKRVFLTHKLVEINKKVKAQQIEQYLKNANAKLVIRIMRRLKSDITDDEIITIYKEEAEKLRKEQK